MSETDPFASVRASLAQKKSIVIQIKVTPKSPRSEIVGIMADGTIKVRVKSAPERGRANEEIIHILSKALGIDEHDIEILHGTTGKLKKIKITTKKIKTDFQEETF